MTVDDIIKLIRTQIPNICGLNAYEGLIKKVELPEFLGHWVVSSGLMNAGTERGRELTEMDKIHLFIGIIVTDFCKHSKIRRTHLTCEVAGSFTHTLYVCPDTEERDRLIETLRNYRKERIEKDGYESL